MARSRLIQFLQLALALVILVAAAPALSGQDDDDYIKELRKKKAREKAIAEGKDPDAVEPTSTEPAKPKLPPTAAGWVSTIQRKWDSDKETDQQLVREAVDALKGAIGTDEELAKKVAEDFEGFKEKEAERAVEGAISGSGVSVERLRAVLEENRPAALKAIMDPAYTEADGCKKQPEVDAACAPLFGVWRDPVGYAAQHYGLDLKTPADKLEKLALLLGEIVPGLEKWPEGATAESLMRARGAEKLNVKEKEYSANSGILAANEKLEGGTLTEEDKRHVRVLNDYRMMLGKGALSINLTLCKACTGHSKYMNKIKQLAHNIDGHPDGRTPQDRAKRAGFGGSVAENCLVGAGDGDAAVWQWYNAAEHHRNMIGNHSIIGVGHDGLYWTQNFSGGAKGARR